MPATMRPSVDFPQPELTDQADDLATFHCQIDVVDRLHHLVFLRDAEAARQ